MVSPTERDREFIAYLPSERWVLREAQMMSVRRSPTANQAGLIGDRFDVIPVPNATRFR